VISKSFGVSRFYSAESNDNFGELNIAQSRYVDVAIVICLIKTFPCRFYIIDTEGYFTR